MTKSITNIFLILITLLSISSSCKTDMDEIRELLNKEELPDVTVKNLRSEYSISEYTQVRLITPLVYRFIQKDKQYSLFPEGISLMFFDKSKRLHSGLVADYGVYYDTENFAKAKGNVILTNVNGSVLRTEELFLDEKEEKIYSVKSVNIKDKDGFEITGKGGFESNLDFTVYRFTDVTGKIIKEDEEDFFGGGEEKESKPGIKNNRQNKLNNPTENKVLLEKKDSTEKKQLN